jgi:hypothetical protein
MIPEADPGRKHNEQQAFAKQEDMSMQDDKMLPVMSENDGEWPAAMQETKYC